MALLSITVLILQIVLVASDAQLFYRLSDLEKQVASLTSRLSNNELKDGEVESTVKVLSVKQKDLERNLEGLKDDISNAFSVVLSSTGKFTGYIKYNYVRYNNGNHYRTSTGIYTVPSSGVYFFQVNIQTSGYGAALLRQNGSNRFVVYSPNLSYATGSKSMIFYAKKGDQIGVYRGSSSYTYSGSSSYAYNSFLGMRLF